jgi:hypothetical protein
VHLSCQPNDTFVHIFTSYITTFRYEIFQGPLVLEFCLASVAEDAARAAAAAALRSKPPIFMHDSEYDDARLNVLTHPGFLTENQSILLPLSIMRCGHARAMLLLLLFLAATGVADAYICRYNCSTINNIYCKTKDTVCPYPDGDDLAMERANMLLAKSTKKKCTRAMKLFICHLWFPTCEKTGGVGNVKPVSAVMIFA